MLLNCGVGEADLIKAVISGDMSKDLAKACRVIIPIKRIEIRKTEVLAEGEGEPESIMDAAPVEETEEEAPAEEPAEETVADDAEKTEE